MTSTDLFLKKAIFAAQQILTKNQLSRPKDRKKAEKLTEYCEEAQKAGYNFEKLTQLREKYKEIA